MAYTTQQLAALETALATGQRRITFGEMSVEYRSADELVKAIAEVKAGLAEQTATAAGTRTVRQYRMHTSKGF